MHAVLQSETRPPQRHGVVVETIHIVVSSVVPEGREQPPLLVVGPNLVSLSRWVCQMILPVPHCVPTKVEWKLLVEGICRCYQLLLSKPQNTTYAAVHHRPPLPME